MTREGVVSGVGFRLVLGFPMEAFSTCSWLMDVRQPPFLQTERPQVFRADRFGDKPDTQKIREISDLQRDSK